MPDYLFKGCSSATLTIACIQNSTGSCTHALMFVHPHTYIYKYAYVYIFDYAVTYSDYLC